MEKRRRKVIIISATLLGIFLVLSLIFFLLFEADSVKRVLFFPNDIDGELNGEVRKLPEKGSAEENIALYIKEILLGPTEFVNTRLVSEETTVQSLLFRDNTLYLDFNQAILFTSALKLDFYGIIETLEKSIYFNFPFVEAIVITVNGQEIERAT